jgi:hypothetical protein
MVNKETTANVQARQSVEMSDQAILTRLEKVSQLRDLARALKAAKPPGANDKPETTAKANRR